MEIFQYKAMSLKKRHLSFRPCSTQTQLYNQRRWLVACNFGYTNYKNRFCTIREFNSRVWLITMVLIWAFVFDSIKKTCPCNIMEIIFSCKIENFIGTNLIFFLFLLKHRLWVHVRKLPHRGIQNIYCGCTLEPPRRGSSNEYPQSIFS